MARPDFEIHVNRGGRWSIESAEQTEAAAIEAAKRRVGMPGVEGVRVVKEETSRIGKVSEKILYEQAGRSGDTGVITVGALDETPERCEKAADLYGGGARQAMAKLFRNYTSKMNITVSEVLYNGRELKRVMEKDNLLSSAVAKVATLQTTQGDQQGAKTRRDELFGMIDEVLAKANAVEKTPLPSIAAVGFAALEQQVASKAADPSERDYLIRVAISRDLLGERSLLGKLENVIKWGTAADPKTAVGALDDFIADILTDASVIQDVLGRRDNLLAAILAMLDLLNGQMTLPKAKGSNGGAANGSANGGEATSAAANATGEPDPLGERLNKLIADDRLPGAVAVIADRLQTMIASRNPLVRDAASDEEKDALRGLIERLVPADGTVRADPGILMALLERGARMVNKGGEIGRNEAVEYLSGLLLEPARKVRFLLALHAAASSDGLKAHISKVTQDWMAEHNAATQFHADSKNPALVMRAVTNLFYHVRDNAPAEELKGAITAHLENLLFEYIDKGQIIQRVDDPTRPLRQRARLLMSMCLPDMMPPGKAVEAARVRVVNYLRQPDFTTQVVADLTDPAEKEKALRDLFDLMRRAGFKM